jgi:tRNA/tmRNA/rRNA uracil-C5-methylase (TrmA/RlmC/RlmD family)
MLLKKKRKLLRQLMYRMRRNVLECMCLPETPDKEEVRRKELCSLKRKEDVEREVAGRFAKVKQRRTMDMDGSKKGDDESSTGLCHAIEAMAAISKDIDEGVREHHSADIMQRQALIPMEVVGEEVDEHIWNLKLREGITVLSNVFSEFNKGDTMMLNLSADKKAVRVAMIPFTAMPGFSQWDQTAEISLIDDIVSAVPLPDPTPAPKKVGRPKKVTSET